VIWSKFSIHKRPKNSLNVKDSLWGGLVDTLIRLDIVFIRYFKQLFVRISLRSFSWD
jgi:hypothetical protein